MGSKWVRDVCEKCGKVAQTREAAHKKHSRCYDCQGKHEQIEWLEEMKSKGCNVCDPTRIGELPTQMRKRIQDCKAIIVNGEKYRDTTDLIFRSTNMKSVYASKESQDQKLEREEKKQQAAAKERIRNRERNLLYNKKMQDPKEFEKLTDAIDGEIRKGLTWEEIREKLEVTEHYFYMAIEVLRKDGRYAGRSNRYYTTKDEQKIWEMLDASYSIKEIAKEMDRTYSSLKGKISRMRREREEARKREETKGLK